jgi:Arc/MetJ family transcription regulator
VKTLIDVDEQLLKKAMQLARTETKKETVQQALEELIKLKLRQRLKDMAGSGAIQWSLDGLKASRRKRERIQARVAKENR